MVVAILYNTKHLCLSLSLTLCICFNACTQGSSNRECCSRFRTDGLHLQHLVSEFKVLQLAVGRHQFIYNILDLFSWRTEKRKTHTKLHFTELNHCWSRLVNSTSPCKHNHSKWSLLTTSDSIVLPQTRRHSNRSLDAIHTFVVTTRSWLGARKQPQSVLHFAERHSR